MDKARSRAEESRDTRRRETKNSCLPQAKFHNGRVFFPSFFSSFLLATLRLSSCFFFRFDFEKKKRPRFFFPHSKSHSHLPPLKIKNFSSLEKKPKQNQNKNKKGSSPSTARATGPPSPPCSPAAWASSAASAGTTSCGPTSKKKPGRSARRRRWSGRTRGAATAGWSWRGLSPAGRRTT